jgi:predicted short-subunit dehydrogenase-like oxidoreductase (DUF2520 family)
MMIRSLNIVGAGKVGRVFGRLFAQHKAFQIRQVLSRSALSLEQAMVFIGAGVPVTAIAELTPADVTMLTVPDDQIAIVCKELVELGLIKSGSIVFHCSGAKASTELIIASAVGAAVASVHPVCSFADPGQLAEHFKGSICSLEGDEAALQVLMPSLQAIQAKVVLISAANKLLYHAGSVFASNYLVTLMETALQTYQAAGIPAEMAQAMAEPLARKSLDNVFRLGTVAALTGPIARGDMATVEKQAEVMREWDATAGNLYAAFIAPTIVLAAQKQRHYSEK